jgi:hypothetical protein
MASNWRTAMILKGQSESPELNINVEEIEIQGAPKDVRIVQSSFGCKLEIAEPADADRTYHWKSRTEPEDTEDDDPLKATHGYPEPPPEQPAQPRTARTVPSNKK